VRKIIRALLEERSFLISKSEKDYFMPFLLATLEKSAIKGSENNVMSKFENTKRTNDTTRLC